MNGINLIASVFTAFVLALILWAICTEFNLDFPLIISLSALALSIVTIALKGEDDEKDKKN